MNKLVIGFSKPANQFMPIFSWLIRLVMRTPYSHVYIKFYEANYDRMIIFQASGTKVNFIRFESFLEKEEVVREFYLDISDESFKKLVQDAIDTLGKPYSMLQILNSLIYVVCRKNPFDNHIIGFDCSKLVQIFLKKELGFEMLKDEDVVTPKDIYKFLEDKYGKDVQ